jgi:competence protein ComEA
MHEISRPQLAVYAAAAIAIALVGVRYLRAAPPARAPAAPPATVRVEDGSRGGAVVQVAGAVRRPGVYRLGPGSRVVDAVRRAGGATRRADVTAVNLAARLEDGRQVIVPRRGPAAGAAGAAGGPPTSSGVSPTGAGAPGQPVNLNTATPDQLDTLDGVGPETARKIMAYRVQHGGFRSVDELDQVPGIGAKRLAALRPLVRV